MSLVIAGAMPAKRTRIWLLIGLALLAYSAAGNYLVLPGYRRFLEHGSPHAGGSGIDPALIWGAIKTIVWMLSFHVGALLIAYAALVARGDAIAPFRKWFVSGALLWIALWTIPKLPGPYTAFFAVLGIVILTLIVTVFAKATGSRFGAFQADHWLIASLFFFAIATWDICGLGSVGGILHPADEVRASSQSLVVAQTTKLIIELALAWGLLAVAAFRGDRARD